MGCPRDRAVNIRRCRRWCALIAEMRAVEREVSRGQPARMFSRSIRRISFPICSRREGSVSWSRASSSCKTGLLPTAPAATSLSCAASDGHAPWQAGAVTDGAQPMDERRIAEFRSAELTYPEVGMTQHAVLPAGYRTFQRTVPLPVHVRFASARRDLLTWMVQRRAGIRVTASGDVAPDVVADLTVGSGALSVIAPCRVVYLIEEPTRCGFAYGTLRGHPESGEESFMLNRGEDGAVTFTVTAFSHSATILSKLAGPIGHRVQDFMTARYLRAFT
jgi:uncharacterized protein (UPF0548 family)